MLLSLIASVYSACPGFASIRRIEDAVQNCEMKRIKMVSMFMCTIIFIFLYCAVSGGRGLAGADYLEKVLIGS